MLTVKEAAKELNISEVRVRQLIKAGFLAASRVGNSWLIEERDVASRIMTSPGSGRPANQEEVNEDASFDVDDQLSEIFQICKEKYSNCPSVDELINVSSEEAAFRVAIHEFFLDRKQAELVSRGVY